MAPGAHVSRSPRAFGARRLLPLLTAALLLAVAACGSTPEEEPGAAAGPGPAATEPDEGGGTAAPRPEPEQDPEPATIDENLTDGCVDEHIDGADYFPDKVEFEEAASVTVAYHGHYKVVEVTTADLPEGSPQRLVLLQCGTPAPDLAGDLAGAQVIEVPVQEVVTLTTTNLPHFVELDLLDRLAGVGTGAFVTTPEVEEKVQAGELDDHADAVGQPDLERLVASEPDLLVVDGFGEALLDDVGRFVDAGVPTAVNADFNERTLLGRAEWVKYTALFTNTEARAEEVYGGIRDRYLERRESATHYEGRPRVLVNTPYEGTWFAPAGESFMANAIADAGGEYVFADTEGTGSLAYDIETVLDAAADADVWIQAGSVEGTLDDLLAVDERFANFEAFSEGEVWAWDAWTTEGGGNAVFELAYLHADLFLDDLVAALHPEAREDIEPTFFGQVPPAR